MTTCAAFGRNIRKVLAGYTAMFPIPMFLVGTWPHSYDIIHSANS